MRKARLYLWIRDRWHTARVSHSATMSPIEKTLTASFLHVKFCTKNGHSAIWIALEQRKREAASMLALEMDFSNNTETDPASARCPLWADRTYNSAYIVVSTYYWSSVWAYVPSTCRKATRSSWWPFNSTGWTLLKICFTMVQTRMPETRFLRRKYLDTFCVRHITIVDHPIILTR